MTTRRVSLCLWLLLAGAQIALAMERLPSSFTAPVLAPDNDDHRFRQTESSEGSLPIQSSFGSSSSGGPNNPWQNSFPIASSSASAPPLPRSTSRSSASSSSSSASASLASKPPSAGTDTFALPPRPHLGDSDGSEESSSLASASVEGMSQSLEAVSGPADWKRSNNPKSVDDPLIRQESSSGSAESSTVSSGFSRTASISQGSSSISRPLSSQSSAVPAGDDAPPRPNYYNPLFSIESPAKPRPNVIVSGENSNQMGRDKDLPIREEALPEAQNCQNIAAEVELVASDRRARQAQISARDQDLTQLSLRVELAQEKVTAIHKDMAAFVRKNRPQADDLELKHFRERYDDAKMEVAKAKLKRDDFFAATDAEDNQILREKFSELPRIMDTLNPLEARMVQERARWQKESGKLSQSDYQAGYAQLKQLACSILVLRTKAKALSNLEGEFKLAVDKRQYEKSESERRHRQWAAMHSRVARQQKVTRLHQLEQILDEFKSIIQDKESRFRRDSRSGVLRLKSSVRNAIQEIVNLKKQRAAAEEERLAVKRDLAVGDTPTPEPADPNALPAKVSFAMSSQRKSSSSLASQTLDRLETQTIQMLSATSAP